MENLSLDKNSPLIQVGNNPIETQSLKEEPKHAASITVPNPGLQSVPLAEAKVSSTDKHLSSDKTMPPGKPPSGNPQPTSWMKVQEKGHLGHLWLNEKLSGCGTPTVPTLRPKSRKEGSADNGLIFSQGKETDGLALNDNTEQYEKLRRKLLLIVRSAPSQSIRARFSIYRKMSRLSFADENTIETLKEYCPPSTMCERMRN